MHGKERSHTYTPSSSSVRQANCINVLQILYCPIILLINTRYERSCSAMSWGGNMHENSLPLYCVPSHSSSFVMRRRFSHIKLCVSIRWFFFRVSKQKSIFSQVDLVAITQQISSVQVQPYCVQVFPCNSFFDFQWRNGTAEFFFIHI